MRPEKDIQAKINEFGALSDEIDKINASLKRLKSQYTQLEKELRPVIDEMEALGETALETETYLLSLKQKGYERMTPKYKEAFELALTKVNQATRDILQEALEKTKSLNVVASKWGVQRVKEANEGGTLINKITSWAKSFYSKLSKLNRNMNKLKQFAQKVG